MTLIELLVAMGVTALIMALVLPLVLSNRRTVELDQIRTGVNQTLRASHDLIAADVRIVGERFGDIGAFVLSPIELRPTASGSELVLRRFLLEALPVCQAQVNGESITVADIPSAGGGGGPALPGRCLAQRTIAGPGGDWPPNLFEWRTFLDASPVAPVMAYIHQPDPPIGQFFPVEVRDSSRMMVHCTPSAGSCAWNAAADYSVNNNSIIALMEQIEYRLVDGVLSRINVASGETLRIADGITAFDVTFTLADGSVVDSFAANRSWVVVRGVDVSITSELALRGESVERTMQVSYFPRNLLSR